jgi:hypothetical protein
MAGTDAIAQQMKLVNASELTLIGEERVKGVDSYLLEVVPDMDQVGEILKQQLAAQGLPETIETDELIKDVSMKMWIVKDTFFPTKIVEETGMVASSAGLQLSQLGQAFDVTIDVQLELLAYDYNQNLTIDLPQELE